MEGVVTNVKVSMMLADAADAVGGKLYILGGGWSVTGPQPSPFAIVLDIKVPWHGINVEHKLRLDLIDADGQPVEIQTPDGVRPLFLEGAFTAVPGRDAKPGTPVDLPVALNVPPQPIPPGGRYEWRLTIDGHAHEDWRAAFSTRAVSQQKAA
jgi:hypothetical protein